MWCDAVLNLTSPNLIEIGGLAGAILAAAFHRRAVAVDGFISTAGALIAHALCPTVEDYLIAGHRSDEPGHRIMLEHLGLKPILDLGMRLGEGTGRQKTEDRWQMSDDRGLNLEVRSLKAVVSSQKIHGAGQTSDKKG
jgi:hypothetical protein